MVEKIPQIKKNDGGQKLKNKERSLAKEDMKNLGIVYYLEE